METMNKERVIEKLVKELKANLPVILSMEEESVRKAIFAEVCEQVFEQYDNNKAARNLRTIVDYLANFSQVEEVINGIDFRVNNHTLVEYERRENEDDFDARFGTTTRQIVEQFEMDESITLDRFINSTRYYPSPVLSVRAALDRLAEFSIPYENNCFIDIGSGMGRNLLIASDYPFREIHGVEIGSYLHEVAQANLEIYQSNTQRCHDFQLHCINALDFEYPDGDLVLYFWEPFSEIVSTPFIEKLERHLQEKGIRVTLIFMQGVFPAVKSSKIFQNLATFDTPDRLSAEGGYFNTSIYLGDGR